MRLALFAAARRLVVLVTVVVAVGRRRQKQTLCHGDVILQEALASGKAHQSLEACQGLVNERRHIATTIRLETAHETQEFRAVGGRQTLR
jgi:hypothetical protein